MAKESKKAEEKTLKKHSAAIQIEGNITLLQRKAWNVLLWNAYDELPVKDRYTIRVPDIIRILGFHSDNDEYLREALKALVHCSVEWNVLDKDGHTEWGVAALLAEAKISNGICTYAYGPTLREKLYNPTMFARLDLDLQKRFGSKYALALWELCTDYLGAKRDYGETPWIAMEDFRMLMGIKNGEYIRLSNLKARVISPAMTEVNAVSDFRVTAEHQNKGRKVTALKFKMRRVALLPEPKPAQASLFPEHDDMPLLVKELTDAGLSTQDAFEIWQQGFAFVEEVVRPQDTGEEAEDALLRYVREKIHLLKRRQAAGKVENATGFLREALRQNYANPEYEADRQQDARKAAQQAAADAQREAARREERARHLQRQHDDALQALCDQMIAAAPGLLEQAVAWARAHAEGFRVVYAHTKSPADNYRDSIGVRAILNPYLERQHPDAFAALKAQHQAERDAL